MYLSFIGSDDVWLPDSVEKQLKRLESDPSLGLVYGLAQYITKDGSPSGGVLGRDFSGRGSQFDALVLHNTIPALTVMVTREALESVGLFDENLTYSDWELWIRILHNYKAGFIDEVLAKYRIHDTNTSIGIGLSPERLRQDLYDVLGSVRRRFGPSRSLDRGSLQRTKLSRMLIWINTFTTFTAVLHRGISIYSGRLGKIHRLPSVSRCGSLRLLRVFFNRAEEMTYSRPGPSHKIPSLDGLRAISIAMVVVSHIAVGVYHDYSQNFGRIAEALQLLFVVGHLGVTVFFVISGFLITTLLLRETNISLKNFYFRRTLRIFPPYYFYLLVILGLGFVGAAHTDWLNTTAAFTYTRNYFFHDQAPDAWYLGHTWSLAVEEQFYLIFPASLLLLGTRFRLVPILAALVCCPLLRLAYVLNDPTTSIEFSRFETVADSLAIGCLLAMLQRRLHQNERYLALIGSPAMWLMPVVAIGITWLGNFPHYYSIPAYALIAFTVQNCCLALIIDSCVTNSHTAAGRLLNWRPLVFVGLISYSIYLWQQPFLNPELQLPILIKVFLLVIAALFSYYIIEKPALRFRKFLENRKFAPQTLTSWPLRVLVSNGSFVRPHQTNTLLS